MKQIRNAVEVRNTDKRVVSLGVSKTTPEVFVNFHLSMMRWLFHTSPPLPRSFSTNPTVLSGAGTHLMSINYENKSFDLLKANSTTSCFQEFRERQNNGVFKMPPISLKEMSRIAFAILFIYLPCFSSFDWLILNLSSILLQRANNSAFYKLSCLSFQTR